MSKRLAFLPYAIAIAASAVLALSDIPKSLGAHPWWATMVVWRGLPIGLIIAFALQFTGMSKMLRAVLISAVIVIAAFVSSYNHANFVAAEDADAYWPGLIWFYGWITMMAALPALIVTVLQKRRA